MSRFHTFHFLLLQWSFYYKEYVFLFNFTITSDNSEPFSRRRKCRRIIHYALTQLIRRIPGLPITFDEFHIHFGTGEIHPPRNFRSQFCIFTKRYTRPNIINRGTKFDIHDSNLSCCINIGITQLNCLMIRIIQIKITHITFCSCRD